MRVVDVIVAFPFMVFVIAIVAVFGAGPDGIYIGLIAFGWAFYARITRAEMLVAARAASSSWRRRRSATRRRRILLRHALPNLLRPALVFSMSDVVLNILLLATLSYLGLGVQPPTPEWGAIVADGQKYILTPWWLVDAAGPRDRARRHRLQPDRRRPRRAARAIRWASMSTA